MLNATRLTLLLLVGVVGCTDPGDGVFVPDPDDEMIDPDDPPLDPDPVDTEERLISDAELAAAPELATDDDVIALKASCPKRAARLSPRGLTFVIHVPRKDDASQAALKQLKAVRHLVRARDIFYIERNSPVVRSLRRVFPCNDFHYIAFPEELADAFAAGKLVDGIAVDWERDAWTHPASYSIEKLDGYAAKIRDRGQVAAVVPYWPAQFDDAHIVKASRMDYELAQIQNRCAHDSALGFGNAAKALVVGFRANGLSGRDVGFEISLNSVADADNHTGVDRSAACTRKAYGKGARAIYLYGNGHPHFDDYFRRIAQLGLRSSR